MKNLDYLKYTYIHRKSLKYFIEKCEYLSREEKFELLKRAEIHDVDKMVLYLFLDKKEASKIHRSTQPHHIENAKTRLDYLECIFDFECAALTKPDKPLNAYDTMLEFYPQYKDVLLPLLEELHMNSSYIAVDKEDIEFIQQFDVTEEDILYEVLNYVNQNKDNSFEKYIKK